MLDVSPSRTNDNGHAGCGAIRDSARRLITSFVTSAGRKLHEISPAHQSTFVDTADHQHYATGDLHRDIAQSNPTRDSIIVGIDVDYYLVDPEHYLGFPVPGIYFTFNPLSVSGRDTDSSFRIMDNRVHYDVSGGGTWVHEVWDWCAMGEFVEARAYVPWYLRPLALVGLRKYMHHKIHHARPWLTAPHRAIVWTIPTASFWRFGWIKSDLQARKLKRVKYADANRPGWNAIIDDSGREPYINLGRAGEDANLLLPKVDFDVLMGLQSAQSVTTRMIQMGHKEPDALALMGQYFNGKVVILNDAPRVGRPVSQPTVHWPASFEADLPVTSARNFASPIVSDVNLVPMIKRWECLSDSLDQRVEFVRNPKIPSTRLQQYANEFVRLVVPVRGTGVRYSLEETAAQLDKPAQILAISQIWETVDSPHRRLIEAFVKNEPTNKSGRIISSFADTRFLL